MGKNIGILLAAGAGRRMESDEKKQFMQLSGKPLMCSALEKMEKSSVIDDIIVVTGADDVDHVKNEIIGKYDYKKVSKVIPGGSERCLSVWEGIKACGSESSEDYIFIHDAARPFLTEDILKRADEAVKRTGACVVGMPARDTIRLSDGGFAGETIPRDKVWMMQTPQVFRLDIAYKAFLGLEKLNPGELKAVTDDVMVVQAYDPDIKIELVEGSSKNIKITTPEDMTYLS